jgi:hypothetical protein
LACQRFCHHSRSCCRSLRNSTAVIRCPKMPSRMAQWFYDQSRTWTFPLSCVHLVSISGQCDASIKQKSIMNCEFCTHRPIWK